MTASINEHLNHYYYVVYRIPAMKYLVIWTLLRVVAQRIRWMRQVSPYLSRKLQCHIPENHNFNSKIK